MRAKTWALAGLGFALAILVNIIFPFPFLGAALGALAVSLLEYRKLKPRAILAYFLIIGGLQLVVIGVLLILGITPPSYLSVAFTVTLAVAPLVLSGFELGVVALVVGLIGLLLAQAFHR